jgi:hypothetical protein
VIFLEGLESLDLILSIRFDLEVIAAGGPVCSAFNGMSR